jgi:hypothetical protein
MDLPEITDKELAAWFLSLPEDQQALILAEDELEDEE